MDRYAEELHRPHEELAGILERIRVRKLEEADKQVVSTLMAFCVVCFLYLERLTVRFKTLLTPRLFSKSKRKDGLS